MRYALSATAFALLVSAAAPWTAAPAQNQRILTIYGNDKCPTDADGEEIYVCRRLDESERYRISPDLREDAIDAREESWSDRAASVDMAGKQAAGGVGSCSNVGGGAGATGCFVQRARAARAQNEAEREAVVESALPQ